MINVFFFLLGQGLVFWKELGDLFASQYSREFSKSHFLGLSLVCTNTIWLYGKKSFSCIIPGGSRFPHSNVFTCTPFGPFCCIQLYVIWALSFVVFPLIFTAKWLVLMAVFCDPIYWDSVSFFRVPFFSDAHGSRVSVCQWSWRPGFNPRLHHTKDF